MVKLISVRHAAMLLGVSINFLYNAKSQRLEPWIRAFVKLGRRVLVDTYELGRIVEEGKERARNGD